MSCVSLRSVARYAIRRLRLLVVKRRFHLIENVKTGACRMRYTANSNAIAVSDFSPLDRRHLRDFLAARLSLDLDAKRALALFPHRQAKAKRSHPGDSWAKIVLKFCPHQVKRYIELLLLALVDAATMRLSERRAASISSPEQP